MRVFYISVQNIHVNCNHNYQDSLLTKSIQLVLSVLIFSFYVVVLRLQLVMKAQFRFHLETKQSSVTINLTHHM